VLTFPDASGRNVEILHRLSDPHATPAHAHPRADLKPGFKLQFKLRQWPMAL
jgi:hypothetical protein